MSITRILVLSSDPLADPANGGGAPLQLGRNEREIRQGVATARYRQLVEIHTRAAVRTRDLLEALLDVRPQIVHFSGHGDDCGLVMIGPDGITPHRVDGKALGGLLEALRDEVQLVVLSACHSHDDAVAIAEVVGCAIGTQGPIGDNPAISFDAALYSALASGLSVEKAYRVARSMIGIEHPNPRNDPELVVRPGVDASRLILVKPGTRLSWWQSLALLLRSWGTRFSLALAVALTAVGAKAMAFGWLAAFTIALIPLAPILPLLRNNERPLWKRRAITAACFVVWSAAVLWLFDGFAAGDDEPAWVDARVPKAELCPALPTDPADHSTEPALSTITPGTTGFATGRTLFDSGDYVAAFPILKEAAARGEKGATGYVGLSYVCGLGTGRDVETGVDLLRHASESGGERDPRAMVSLALAYERRLDGIARPHLIRHWLTTAVEETGDAEALRHLGRLALMADDVDSTMVYLQRAADAGSVDAMVDLGYMHEEKLPEGRRDTVQARRLYLAAAQKGAARGMFALGLMEERKGDLRAARGWYIKAANAGSADAMNNLGVLYQVADRGDGVRRSRLTAQRWYRRAVEAGSTEAAANLAAMRGG